MVKLVTISNEEIFGTVVDMRLPPEQDFVAPNIVSLAQAWLHYDVARPFAIDHDGVIVGFLMLRWDEPARVADLWRFMILPKYQKMGYGTEALRLAIEMVRSSGKFDAMMLDYVPGNVVASRLYRKMGFVETGEVDGDNEIVMRMPL